MFLFELLFTCYVIIYYHFLLSLQSERVASVQATIEQPQAIFRNLNTCNRYWVIITGRYCTNSGSSTPMLVELYKTYPYELTLSLDSKDGPCSSWIVKDPETKAADLEAGLRTPTSLCGFDIPCYEGSTWRCDEKDPLSVTFE